MNPIEKFDAWYQEECQRTNGKFQNACCLSSIGLDGFPNSRFLALKEVRNGRFVITGSLKSRKGIELLNDPKASLTFWWPETERQVRIQGIASEIEAELAERYFSERSRESRIVSLISEQGKNISDLSMLMEKYRTERQTLDDRSISRPSAWSGFYIDPLRIEFLQFKSSRFHIRELASKSGNGWTITLLQP